LATAEVNHQNFLTNEKNKLRELNDQEIRNLMDMNENHIEELRSENNKLKNLLDSKST
jgi:cell shape-determining protein MreC